MENASDCSACDLAVVEIGINKGSCMEWLALGGRYILLDLFFDIPIHRMHPVVFLHGVVLSIVQDTGPEPNGTVILLPEVPTDAFDTLQVSLSG